MIYNIPSVLSCVISLQVCRTFACKLGLQSSKLLEMQSRNEERPLVVVFEVATSPGQNYGCR